MLDGLKIVSTVVMFTGRWCNGNTTVFGTVIRGSSPCRPAKFFEGDS